MYESQICNDSIAMEAFWKGLNKDNLLYESFTKTVLETIIDARSWAAKYIKLEEDQRLEKKEKSKSIKKGKAIMEVVEPLVVLRPRQTIDNPPRF